jgi:hypothetical protein
LAWASDRCRPEDKRVAQLAFVVAAGYQRNPVFRERGEHRFADQSANFGGQIGLLSIDIDGVDYWIWNAIRAVNPILVVCEYNGVFGDLVPIVVPYDQKFDRTRAHPSNVYWGASISALEMLAKAKGYEFVGTNSTGHNAFLCSSGL